MTGLVGWWPLHENSGSTARDLSGNGNHGTVRGPVQGVWGRGGLTSYRQTLDSDYVRMPSTDLGGFDNMTFSFWFRWDGVFESHLFRIRPTQAQLFDFQSRPDSPNALICNLEDSNGTGHTVEREIQNLDDLEADKWTHGAATYERNGMMKVYIDGELVGTKDVDDYPVTDFSNDAYTKNNGFNQAFRGYIQDIRVYNRTLSSQEIQTLYEWGSGDYTRSSLSDGADSGAISRWKFDDDSDASTAADSWNSNSGDISGAVYNSNAVEGKALSFDGSNDSVSISSQDLDISGSKSVSAWVKMDGTASSEYQRIFQTGTNSGGRAYEMWIEDENSGVSFGRTIFRLNHDQSPSSKTCEYIIPDFGYDQWYHYTTVYDYENGELRIYINGALRQLVSYSQQIGSETDHYIGNWADSGNRPWNGLIDDVRVYDRALDSSEVFQLYQWGTRGRDMRKLTVNARGDT